MVGTRWTALLCAMVLLFAGATEPLAKGHRSRKHRDRKCEASQANFDLTNWLFDLRKASHSFSSGQANRGQVVHSEKMDLKGRSWRFLPAIRERGTRYGTFALVRLIQEASDAVAEEFPGSITEIGNMGLAQGGPIIQSKSHQAGRDVDVAFFGVDGKGRSRQAGQFLAYRGKALKARNGWTLDVPRTWTFVKTLLSSTDPAVQWIFVSRPIRQALLDHARNQKEPRELVRLAGVVLHQPGDSTPHNDHMHIRIFCNGFERAAGCRDYGPVRSHLERDDGLLEERLAHLEPRTRMGLTEERLQAIDEYLVLAAEEGTRRMTELLCDADPRIVERALTHVKRYQRETWFDTVARKLSCSGSRAGLAVLLKATAGYRSVKVWQAARKVLAQETCLVPDLCKGEDCTALDELCRYAARSLGYARNPDRDGAALADLLEAKNKRTRQAAERSLRTLYATRHPILPGDDREQQRAGRKNPAKGWQRLVEHGKGMAWDQQVRAQLIRQGFQLEPPLQSRKNIETLLQVVRKGHPVSYSAQVVLARLFQEKLPRALAADKAYRHFHARVENRATPPAAPASASGTANADLPPLPVD